MIYLIATLKVAPGDTTQLLEDARAVVGATRTEPGCLLYDLHISVTDPTRWVFVEEWKSREDLAAHFEQPHMATWRKASEGWFVERKVQVIYPEQVENL